MVSRGQIGGPGWARLLLIVCTVASSGATCVPWARRPKDVDAPIVFERTPTLPEVVQKVNQNAAAVRQLQADSVRISSPGLPSLKATLALEMPRRFRLQGDFLVSRELDVGSNDELFWVWGKNATGALIYARHDEFTRSAARHLMPIEPQWLIESLGVVMLDPTAPHFGPYAHGPGLMEVHTQLVAESGEVLTKITVIHAVYGWVTEQHIRDESGQILASAKASHHRHYAEAGVTLPDIVDIEIAPGEPSQLAFRIDIGGYRVNEPIAADPDLWSMPVAEDYPHINLADPAAADQLRRLGNRRDVAAIDPHSNQPYRPEYRGYTRR